MIFANLANVAERAVESVAALCLGGAVGLAIFELLPLAGGLLALAALAGGVAAGVAAFMLVANSAPREFAVAGFDPAAVVAGDDDVLLLDQPIAAIAVEPRRSALALREAGAMIARINDFLEPGAVPSRRIEARDAVRPDASAALHAALDEIRHSLSRA